MSCRWLETERLILRPPEAGDIAAMVPLANDYDVAKNLASMPHPYAREDAERFIARADEGRAKGSDFAFAITGRDIGAVMGVCGLHLRESGLFNWATGSAGPSGGMATPPKPRGNLPALPFPGSRRRSSRRAISMTIRPRAGCWKRSVSAP